MQLLDGKIALISGAARGMGAATARLFCAEGGRVMIGDILEAEGCRLAEDLGEAAAFVRLDVTSEAGWRHAVEQTVSRFGQLDILINNAGVFRPSTIESTTAAEYMRIIDVNQLGVFLGMQAALSALKQRGGSIVNMSSVAGLMGSRLSCAYTASKWAVRGMTKSAAIEFAPSGIRVNSVHPGTIDTDMGRAGTDANVSANFPTSVQRTPMGRQGRAEEVAGLILWLASDASSYCTGAEFVIDGGMTAG